MIKELTNEQQEQLEKYRDKWVDIGLNTDPCDFDRAKNAICRAYEQQNLKAPRFFIGPVNSPYEGSIAEQVLGEFVRNKTDFKDENHLNELVLIEVEKRKHDNVKYSTSSQIFGCAEYWLSYYDFFKNVLQISGLDKIDALIDIAESCGWWTPLGNCAIVQHRPLEIHREEVEVDGELRYQAHNTEGPAMLFRGDCEYSNLYAIHGVRVTKKIVDKDFTYRDIENEENTEVRRVMIEIFGTEQYLKECGAEFINEDEFGKLYKKEFENDDPIYMVEVVNSTPEPDGTFNHYFLEIDPTAYGGVKTARAAIASTFRYEDDNSLVFKTPEEYVLSQES